MIPCLLIDDEAMVKTVRFDDGPYLGDPVNVINLFNRFEVDEIVLLDIRATVKGRPPPFHLIERLAAECWVPLAYGGGIRSLEDVRRVLGSGVEKVVLGTVAADTPAVIGQAAEVYGSQAVVVSVDARWSEPSGYAVFVESGQRGLGIDPVTHARAVVEHGAGEILLTAIDRDGTMEGYDLELIASIAGSVGVPVVAVGGAATRADLPTAVRAGASAVAAGSIFVFRGPERGVLINFPARDQLEALFD